MATAFRIGDMLVHRVIEDEAIGFDPKVFFPAMPDAVLAENRGWMQAMGALDARGMLSLCVQSYVVRTPHHTVLVDSCVGNDKERPNRPFWHRRTDDRWMRGLAAAGLTVADIDYVLCTHLHVDHVGWNTRLEGGRWVPTFPRARYLFARTELDHWMARHAREPNPVMADSVLPVLEAGRVDVVGDDHALGDHLRLVPTPGHTPGHVAVELGRGRVEAVMTGDLIHSPLQARHPELSAFPDTDPAQAIATRRRFLECHCEARTLVCTSHFPSPSVGRIARRGDAYRWVAEAV